MNLGVGIETIITDIHQHRFINLCVCGGGGCVGGWVGGGGGGGGQGIYGKPMLC